MQELQEQHSILRNSIDQLKTSESLRATLISHLKEALNEQVLKQITLQGLFYLLHGSSGA
jgi:regulator of Ty1 transposition protein 103